ncbi:type VI secretion protein, VC_A0111 family [Novosphingobium sp. CF614]|uniref:type VI secretion system baseplate subunit TssG n=1 Tax=Novosphingobium sp. CF614 TaxID=1884364 RepID=UPI0008E1C7DB|nr:type VI secretion system baseplate subunit TssG [Novosphingobium sp. CF614]SFF95155.1 type VI secretion protein, VC_A0111 family [Novosphingobium sp. CF614]
MIAAAELLERIRRSTFVQAARTVQGWARGGGNTAEVGRDDLPAVEPIRFSASDRMGLPANDVAGADAGGAGRGDDRQVRVVSNVMGLAGATPALPPPYSELQLQRRRARDFALGHFLAIFDHRALSFFWRIAEKYSWPLMAERAGRGKQDPVQDVLVALAGIGQEGARDRLDIRDRSLVTLVAHLADVRRSAASVETVLQVLTGLPLRIVEATPTWMAVPPSEQTRIGGAQAQFAQLGQPGDEDDLGVGEAAMIGAAVLDAQHHYVVEIGPLTYRELQDFCCRRESRRIVAQLCALAAGLEQRPSMRLLIATADIPALRLGDAGSPAMLGWTTWMGTPVRPGGIANDCLIPIDPTAMMQKTS